MVLFFTGVYKVNGAQIIIRTTCRQCLAFCCTKQLQEELDTFKIYWNSHNIRPSRHSDSPDGYPDDVHDMPELYG